MLFSVDAEPAEPPWVLEPSPWIEVEIATLSSLGFSSGLLWLVTWFSTFEGASGSSFDPAGVDSDSSLSDSSSL